MRKKYGETTFRAVEKCPDIPVEVAIQIFNAA
jgi:hypothetical protein